MQIGELAQRAGVNVQTVRFYERRALLDAPKRKASGYRVYQEADLLRLRFILHAKSLGFTLGEIRRRGCGTHLTPLRAWPREGRSAPPAATEARPREA